MTVASQILVDLMVVLVTWRKTFGQIKTAAALGMRVELSTILLRDGEILAVGTSGVVRV